MSLIHSFCIYFSEGGDENYYYTTKLQLQELLEVLDPNDLEYELYRTIEDVKDEVIRQMDITEKLTNSAKGNKKSYLEIENGNYSVLYNLFFQSKEINGRSFYYLSMVSTRYFCLYYFLCYEIAIKSGTNENILVLT